VFVCADADVRHGHLIAYGWTIGVSVDTILLSLTLYRALQHSKEGRMEGGLMQLLTRDQTLFFFPYAAPPLNRIPAHDLPPRILGIFVANQIIWLINHVKQPFSRPAVQLT
jgi:hypothetical protein